MSEDEGQGMPKREDFEDEIFFREALDEYFWRQDLVLTEDEYDAYCELREGYRYEYTLASRDAELSDGKRISVVVTHFDDGESPDEMNTKIIIIELDPLEEE